MYFKTLTCVLLLGKRLDLWMHMLYNVPLLFEWIGTWCICVRWSFKLSYLLHTPCFFCGRYKPYVSKRLPSINVNSSSWLSTSWENWENSFVLSNKAFGIDSRFLLIDRTSLIYNLKHCLKYYCIQGCKFPKYAIVILETLLYHKKRNSLHF